MKPIASTCVTRRRFLAGGAATLASAGFALAGCANAGANATSDDPPAADTSAEEGSSSENSAGESSAATRESHIHAACASASTNYNPIGLNGGAALTMSATRHVFEGLYDLDLHTNEAYAALAAGEPAMNSATSCEITLREGAAFSDGAPVVASDVVNAFQKNMANATVGPLLEFIDSVSAADERTISLSLKYPFEGLLPKRLSLVKVFPAARESEFATNPIGSGPWAYAVGGLQERSHIDFVPNEHYNGPFPAEADRMTWIVIDRDANLRDLALRDHAVQVAEDIPASNIEALERTGARVERVQGFCQPFLMFNTLKRPFSDKRVRQAIFYAIDCEKLIDEKLGGLAKPLTSFLPPDHPNYHRAATVYTHAPDRARALLADAKCEDLSFTLSVNDNWVADLAPQIADDLRACGIECEIKEGLVRWDELSATDRVLSYDAVLAAGDPSCFGNDPDLLLSWWYGDNVWTQGRSCWARSQGDAFSTMQALLQAAREATGEERQDLWNQCFDLAASEVPLYGLCHLERVTGWHPDRIQGFHPIATSGLDLLGCSIS